MSGADDSDFFEVVGQCDLECGITDGFGVVKRTKQDGVGACNDWQGFGSVLSGHDGGFVCEVKLGKVGRTRAVIKAFGWQSVTFAKQQVVALCGVFSGSPQTGGDEEFF